VTGTLSSAEPWNAEVRLKPSRLGALLLRSFFLQGSWSYERMQSVGWTAALSGEGRQLAAGPGASAFLRRHLDYFNTNPVMASYLLGGVVRLEEEITAGRAAEEDVARFKRGLTSPLAAWGDTFFWASLRPLATALGVVGAWLWGGWGVVVYLVAYNSFHLYYRVRGLQEGYRWGPEVAARLARAPVRTMAGRVRETGLVAAGVLAALGAAPTARAFGLAGMAAFVGLAAMAAFALKRRAGFGTWLGTAAIVAGLVYAWVAAGR
jgi:PTS system mannose-specific IID component